MENRKPTVDDPIAECVYDDDNILVDENHEYAECRGTPDQYGAGSLKTEEGRTEMWNHTRNDTGGVWAHGKEAISESARKRVDDVKKSISETYDFASESVSKWWDSW